MSFSGNLSVVQLETLASALSRDGFAANKEEIRRAVTGREVKFQAFDDKTGFLRADMFLEKSFGRVPEHHAPPSGRQGRPFRRLAAPLAAFIGSAFPRRRFP